MKYFILFVNLLAVSICKGQYEFKTGIEPDYYYDIIIDNPDTNQAKLFVNVKFLNAYLDLGAGSNIGIYPGIQVIYTPNKKKWGVEFNYDNSLLVGENIVDLRNGFFEIGGFYILKNMRKSHKKQFRVNKYRTGLNTEVTEVIKVPIKRDIAKGLRAGLINERIFLNNDRYMSTGFYLGFTRQKNDRSVIKTLKNIGGTQKLTHDRSSWNITNFDILYYFNYSPDPREDSKNWEYEGIPPIGFRISQQALFNFTKKDQPVKVHDIYLKFDFGYKLMQGAFVNFTLGWQAIRR